MVTLSIVMTTYDDEKYLPTAIKAILSQSFTDFELIIVNDASLDNSDAIIEDFAKKDNRIRYFKNEQNLGVVKSQNKGAAAIRGKYTYFASSDDMVLPNCFKEMVSCFLKNPEVTLVVSDNAYFDDGNENVLRVRKFFSASEPKLFSPKEAMHLFKTTLFLVSGHCTMAKTCALKKLDFLNETLEKESDFLLYNTIALTNGFVYIPKALSAMRCFANDKTVNRKEAIRRADRLVSHIKDRKNLWTIFYPSTLIARGVHSSIYTLFLRPKHWRILFPLSFMKLKLFIKKKLKRLKTTWVVERI